MQGAKGSIPFTSTLSRIWSSPYTCGLIFVVLVRDKSMRWANHLHLLTSARLTITVAELNPHWIAVSSSPMALR